MHTCPRRYLASVENARVSAADVVFGNDNKNVAAALEFLRLCEKYGLITPQPASQVGSVIIAPKDWDYEEWYLMLQKHGLPPWPGERSGLPDSEEMAAHLTEMRDGR